MTALLQFYAKAGDIKRCCFPEPDIKDLPRGVTPEVTAAVRKCTSKGPAEPIPVGDVEIDRGACTWCFTLDTTALEPGTYDLEFEVKWGDPDTGLARVCHYPADGYGSIEITESFA